MEAAEAATEAGVAEAGGATTEATESVEEVLLLLLLLPVLLLLPPLLPPPPPDVVTATGGVADAGEATVALFRPPALPEETPAPVTPFLLVVSIEAEAWPPVLPDRWDDDLVSLAINDGLPKLHSALFCSPPTCWLCLTADSLTIFLVLSKSADEGWSTLVRVALPGGKHEDAEGLEALSAAAAAAAVAAAALALASRSSFFLCVICA